MGYNLLSSLSLPEDLKKLKPDEEKELCCEIREKIINTVSKNGGHLASNLGVVELTLAIHRVFDSPDDKIIFDVGHQCYAHKLLTGRFGEFDTLRKKGGISGFPNPDESVHDHVVGGHSSTSISAALGMAQAMKLKGDEHHAVAVIGDGALTGGIAFEGLNNAGRSKTNLVVILNYNEMSISKNIGAIAEYLSNLRINDSYLKIKSSAKKFVSSIPVIGGSLKNSISKSKGIIREHLLHITLFEDLGFEYLGPVDGHDLAKLETALAYAKSLNRPVLVHVNTVKGKGYKPAENNPGDFHGTSEFDVQSGSKSNSTYGFSDAFGIALEKAAKKDERICGITAAMKYATGLNYLKKSFPERTFDVGIAEEHAVAFAAGLSKLGMIPVFAVHSSFLQRSFDQLYNDIALGGHHLVVGISNAGLTGRDGPTHQGTADISYISAIPGATIYSPSCCEEVGYCLEKAIFEDGGLSVLRYPKGEDTKAKPYFSDYNLKSNGSDTLIAAYGREAVFADAAAKKLGCDFLKLLKIYPIDAGIIDIVKKYKRVYIFEECLYEGSIGQKLMAASQNVKSIAIGGFVPHMDVCEALQLYGLSEECIIQTVEKDIKNAET